MSNETGPAIDPSDMADNQKKLLGVSTFNVQQQEHDAEASVKVSVPVNAVDTSVNQSFVDSAPNLPLRLPFHLEHLFGCHDSDGEDKKA